MIALWASSTALADARTDARDAKVDLYVEIYNQFTRTLSGHRERYQAIFGTLDPAATPCATAQRPEREIYHSTYGDGLVTRMRRDLRRGPRMPQDRLATEMLDAAAIAMPAWNEAYDYYHRDVDSADGCALGNQLHARIVPAWTRYFAAEAEMATFLRDYSRERDARILVEIEREHGRNFRWFHLNTVNEVTRIQEAFRAETPDLAAITTIVDGIAAGHAEIAPRAQRSERAVHDQLYQGSYLTFLMGVETFVERTRALVTALRSGGDVDRAANEYGRATDDLIRRSNSVRYGDAVH